MMDEMAAADFGHAAHEALDRLIERFGADAVVGQSIFVVEVQEGDCTMVWTYSTDARGYVQKALLTEAISAVDEHARNES